MCELSRDFLLLSVGASAPLSKDRNVAAGPAGQTQNKELSQSGQKGASGSTATTGAKPKRYSSQRQRVSQQIPAVSSEPVQEQLPAVIPEGYYEQMGEISQLFVRIVIRLGCSKGHILFSCK